MALVVDQYCDAHAAVSMTAAPKMANDEPQDPNSAYVMTERLVDVKHCPLINGRKLAYAVYGVPLGESKSQATAIYMHGWPGSYIEAGICHRAAVVNNVTFVGVSRPGYGSSTADPKMTFESFSKDIGALMDYLGIKKATIVGYSGGSPFACAVAYYLGVKRVSRLVLLAPLSPLDGKDGRKARSQLEFFDRVQLCMSVRSARVARVFLHPVYRALKKASKKHPDLILRVGAGMTEPDKKAAKAHPVDFKLAINSFNDGVSGGGKGLFREGKLCGKSWPFRLEDIDQPTRVWKGTLDGCVPDDMARVFQKRMKACKLDLVPNQGHLSLVLVKMNDIMATIAAEAKA